MILTAHVGLQDGSDPEIDVVNKFLREADGGDYGEFVEVSKAVHLFLSCLLVAQGM